MFISNKKCQRADTVTQDSRHANGMVRIYIVCKYNIARHCGPFHLDTSHEIRERD